MIKYLVPASPSSKSNATPCLPRHSSFTSSFLNHPLHYNLISTSPFPKPSQNCFILIYLFSPTLILIIIIFMSHNTIGKLGSASEFRRCFFSLFLASLWCTGSCQGDADSGGIGDSISQTNDSATVDLFTQLVYQRIANTTAILTPDLTKKFSFCSKDVDADWDAAFNFSSNLRFLSNCIRETRGDVVKRLCTAAEIKFYFSSFVDNGFMGSNYIKLNRNCNLTTWLSGCQPGWACSAGNGQNVSLRYSKDFPDRTSDCQPCCEGFFCPHGLTCMIACPLGSYCPLASLNQTTGVCDPYRYQLPQGQPNHTCGGADIWADISSSREALLPNRFYNSITVFTVN